MSIEKKLRPSKKKQGFHEEMFAETEYYIKNGLRFVYPYKFTFVAHVKLRWVGLKVLELFQKEFQMESVAYYENAIKNGKIKVNDNPTSKDYELTGRDILQTSIHRHEPPITDEPIEFIENNDEMVVINKPSSVPVHPCGRYRHNTVVFLLGKLHGLHSLHTIHRIDRLTSGILMFAKNSNKSRELEKVVKNREVQKEYFARVVGEFPEEEITVNKSILVVSHKVGVCRIDGNGKEAITVFKRKSFNGKTSVVLCLPQTGRMHQIRVHLQWLGHPIVNDPIYNHKTAWRDNKGKNGEEIETSFVVSELLRTRKDKTYDNDTFHGEETKEVENSQKRKLPKEPCSENTTNLTSKKVKCEGDQTDVCDEDNSENQSVQPKDFNSIETCNKINMKDNTQQLCSASDNKSLSSENNSPEKEKDSGETNNEKSDKALPKNTNDIEIRSVISLNDTPCSDSKLLNLENNIPGMKDEESNKAVSLNVSKRPATYQSADLGEEYYDPCCTDCNRTWKEPKRNELIMYLHAYSYRGPGWEYRTSIPRWVNDDYAEDELCN